MEKWTISAIKQANEAAGHVFFDESHVKNSYSRTLPGVHEGPGGVAFVTFDRDHGDDQRYHFKVWSFDPETSRIRMIGERHTEEATALDAAKAYAAGPQALSLSGDSIVLDMCKDCGKVDCICD